MSIVSLNVRFTRSYRRNFHPKDLSNYNIYVEFTDYVLVNGVYTFTVVAILSLSFFLCPVETRTI